MGKSRGKKTKKLVTRYTTKLPYVWESGKHSQAGHAAALDESSRRVQLCGQCGHKRKFHNKDGCAALCSCKGFVEKKGK